ncbi:MAG: hypothetical protein FWD61_12075, partial [Phycisphaerales bacterium]|nr:hypothetical protein [Phycisphaerales bacterium]
TMATFTAIQPGDFYAPTTWQGGASPIMGSDVDLGNLVIICSDDPPSLNSISNGSLFAPIGTTRILIVATPPTSVTLLGTWQTPTGDTAFSNPGITNVKQGVAYIIAGAEKVGTFDPITDNYTDPGVENVAYGATYVFAGNTLTGEYDPSSGFTDPGPENVKLDVAYLFGGISVVGTYNPIPDAKAAQLAEDQAEVLANAQWIIQPSDGGPIILSIEGVFDLTVAKQSAATAQFVIDQSEVEANKQFILYTASILGIQGIFLKPIMWGGSCIGTLCVVDSFGSPASGVEIQFQGSGEGDADGVVYDAAIEISISDNNGFITRIFPAGSVAYRYRRGDGNWVNFRTATNNGDTFWIPSNVG